MYMRTSAQQTQDVNWLYIRRSEDVQMGDVLDILRLILIDHIFPWWEEMDKLGTWLVGIVSTQKIIAIMLFVFKPQHFSYVFFQWFLSIFKVLLNVIAKYYVWKD